MKRMKRFCALLLALCMLFALAPVASAANGTIVMNLNSNKMTVNGTSVAIDADASIKPQVKKINGAGYTMLPLRAVVEAMGGTVSYDSATKVITMTYNGTTMTHTIGTKTATVNGASKTMTIASYAENNRTYVHLRAIELLSSSIKVDWNASSPNTVTITYPQTASNTKSVNLTIKNSTNTTYLQFTSLKLAPAGTKTYSGNLLNTTLIPGGMRALTMSIAPGKYDLCGTDINNNTFYWYNLDFTNVQSSAVLTLTSGSMYTLSLDSTLVGDQTAQVTLINSTGATITGVEVFHSSSTAANATKVYSGNLYTGSYTSFALPYTASAPYYYMKVTFTYGNSLTYSYVNLGSAYVTVNLRGDGTFTYGNTASASGVYFVNKTGSKISTLQMKVGSSGSWSTNLLTGSLKSGDYIEITGYGPSELRNQTVYFRTSTSGNGKSVSVSSTLKKSLVFSLGSSLSVKYDVKPGDTTYEEGLYLYNDSNIYFDYFYVINAEDLYDDYDEDEVDKLTAEEVFTKTRIDGDSYDWEDYDEYVKNFDDGDEVLIDEWDLDELASNTLYFMGEYTKSGTDKVIYGSVTVARSSKFDYNVYVTIDTTTAGTALDCDVEYDYTEDDDDATSETGLLFYNRTGYKADIYVSTSEALTSSNYPTKGDRVIKSLKNKDWEQAEDYDSYKKDVADETIYYWVDSSESGKSYGGSFKMSSSTKENVCITLKGPSSTDTREYNWGIDDNDGDGVYFYNRTGETITKIEAKISSSGSWSTVYNDDVDNRDTVEIDLDLDDISEEKVYIRVTYYDEDDDKQTESDSVTVGEYEDDYDDNVVFKMSSSFTLTVEYDQTID